MYREESPASFHSSLRDEQKMPTLPYAANPRFDHFPATRTSRSISLETDTLSQTRRRSSSKTKKTTAIRESAWNQAAREAHSSTISRARHLTASCPCALESWTKASTACNRTCRICHAAHRRRIPDRSPALLQLLEHRVHLQSDSTHLRPTLAGTLRYQGILTPSRARHVRYRFPEIHAQLAPRSG